jgi:hypothetical protein
VTDRADRHPSVVAAPGDTYVVAWDSGALQSSGANLSLRSAQSADGGRTWSPWQPVGLAVDAMSQRPRLGTDPDGAVRAVWYDSRSADWRWKVFTARWEPATGWSPAVRLSGSGNGAFPAVSAGFAVFTGDRDARGQRDHSQQVYLTGLG